MTTTFEPTKEVVHTSQLTAGLSLYSVYSKDESLASHQVICQTVSSVVQVERLESNSSSNIGKFDGQHQILLSISTKTCSFICHLALNKNNGDLSLTTMI